LSSSSFEQKFAPYLCEESVPPELFAVFSNNSGGTQQNSFSSNEEKQNSFAKQL